MYIKLSTCVHVYVTVYGKTWHMGSAHRLRNARLIPQVEKYQSPVFVIFISKNLSTNLCRCLQRLPVNYKGEISLHFDLPSLYSCRTWSPLLWALIRIFYLDTARFIEEQSAVIISNETQLLLDLYVHFERLRPGPFN